MKYRCSLVVVSRVCCAGKVQGVFFRKHTQEHALKLSLVGYCANTKSGSVVGEAVGAKDNIAKLSDKNAHAGLCALFGVVSQWLFSHSPLRVSCVVVFVFAVSIGSVTKGLPTASFATQNSRWQTHKTDRTRTKHSKFEDEHSGEVEMLNPCICPRDPTVFS